MPICTGCTEVLGGKDLSNPKCQDCIKREEEQKIQSLFDTMFLAQMRSAELSRDQDRKPDQEIEKEDYGRER